MKFNRFLHNDDNSIFSLKAMKILTFGLTITGGLFICALIYFIIGNEIYDLLIKTGLRIIVLSFGTAVFRDILKSGTGGKN